MLVDGIVNMFHTERTSFMDELTSQNLIFLRQ